MRSEPDLRAALAENNGAPVYNSDPPMIKIVPFWPFFFPLTRFLKMLISMDK